jgi:NAD(P)-dependent dehydrogenase (short-subunit alcohol dehydrogenase family)
MKNNFGIIINVSSGVGKVAFEDISVYCASKFGVMGLTESVAWEVGNYSIRVMTICPGEVATKMQELDDWLYPSKYEFPRIFSYRVGEKIFPPNGSRNRLVPNLVMPEVFS